tara:strand:+ start:93 stop:458 length:366 start_codon:yes stop_codon:yes gene_type:complete
MKTLKRIKQTFLILPVLLLLTISLGNNTAWGFAVGLGNTSCGKLLDHERRGLTKTDTMSMFHAYTGWIQGYITGRNQEKYSEKGKDVSDESLLFAVVEYCRNNPRNKIIHAINHIYDNELR